MSGRMFESKVNKLVNKCKFKVDNGNIKRHNDAWRYYLYLTLNALNALF